MRLLRGEGGARGWELGYYGVRRLGARFEPHSRTEHRTLKNDLNTLRWAVRSERVSRGLDGPAIGVQGLTGF